ncbi:dnaJ homolog subfamily C member 5-like [Watersipora subatra]|uniref:dnaJ homolog subfamily C member 5-like n=1 Tax=Watersipora subatra TaxID=2589382 RepID=UPI00355B46B3
MNEHHQSRARALSASGTSFYELLALPKTATKDEIKKAYRKEALKYHPDKNQGNNEMTEHFKKLNHVNAVLTDENKRRIYDAYGSLGLYVAEQFGEENVSTYFMVTSGWCKALFVFCGLITGCYCCCCLCCCCNFCFGKCKPKPDESYEGYDDLMREDGEQSPNKDPDSPVQTPITTEPESANITNAPIAMGPPPSPAPRQTVGIDGTNSLSERSPLYSQEDKPQLQEGYKY